MGENYLSDFVGIQKDFHSVDGSEIRRSPGEVGIFPIIYKVFAPSQVVQDFWTINSRTCFYHSIIPTFQRISEVLASQKGWALVFWQWAKCEA